MQIYKSLGDIMAEAKAIGKDSTNQSQGFKFRGIDAVMNHLHPVFAKHGVIVLPEVLEDRTEDRVTAKGSNLIYRVLRIKFNFTSAVDGSAASATVIGEGMDSGDKAANKAMAVGLKYALSQMLLLPYDEVDPDGETHEPSKPVKHITSQQVDAIQAAVAEGPHTTTELVAKLKEHDIPNIREIPAGMYKNVLAWAEGR